MLSIYPTILRYNRFVYHLTTEEKIRQIKELGLRPQNCGKLYLLRFNIKNRKWYVQDATIGDYFLKTPVRKECLQYITISDIELYYQQVLQSHGVTKLKCLIYVFKLIKDNKIKII